MRIQQMSINGTRGASKAGIKSGMEPVAQSATLCNLGSNDVAVIDRTLGLIAKNSKYELIDKAIIELMFLNGLRISEVLSIKAHDVMWNGLIKIKGLKGSQDRYCISNLYTDYLKNSIAKGSDMIRLRSRYYFHRLFIQKGIYYPATSNRKRIVTHVFRHLYVRINKSNNISMKEIQSLIGHKSINSTLYYHEQRDKRI